MIDPLNDKIGFNVFFYLTLPQSGKSERSIPPDGTNTIIAFSIEKGNESFPSLKQNKTNNLLILSVLFISHF